MVHTLSSLASYWGSQCTTKSTVVRSSAYVISKHTTTICLYPTTMAVLLLCLLPDTLIWHIVHLFHVCTMQCHSKFSAPHDMGWQVMHCLMGRCWNRSQCIWDLWELRFITLQYGPPVCDQPKDVAKNPARQDLSHTFVLILLPAKTTSWVPSNLDIYVPYVHYHYLTVLLKDHGYHLIQEGKVNVSQYCFSLICTVATFTNSKWLHSEWNQWY